MLFVQNLLKKCQNLLIFIHKLDVGDWMNTFIINKVYNIFIHSLELSEVEAIKLRYMLEVIINELLKIIILFIPFYLFGEVWSYIYCLIAIVIIRPMTGGFHTKTFLGCLAFSTCFFGISMLLIKTIPLHQPLLAIICIFDLLILMWFAPIVPKQRPKYSEQKMFHSKLLSIVVVVIHFGFYVLSNSPYFLCAVWVITLQCVQLLIASGGIKYERKIKNTIKTHL